MIRGNVGWGVDRHVARPAGGPIDVLVAVPAHDEAERVPACLASVAAALRAAQATAMVDRAVVALGAHRCRDATAALARAQLSADRVSHLVWETDLVGPVGRVRTALVQRALTTCGLDPARTWLFSTDADTRVPPQWVRDGLGLAARHRAALVVGLVDLTELAVDSPVRQAHDRIVAAGIRPDGSHDHVYAANLLIALDVFARVGGFPDPDHGEEHGLVAAVRAAGYPVVSTAALRVQTSGRTVGRAQVGLHTLLGELVP